MKFVRDGVTDKDTGKSAEYYLPVDISVSNRVYRNGLMLTTVEDEERLLSDQVISTLLEFHKSAARRKKLQQDCGVFALACESGQLLENIRFGKRGRLIGCSRYEIWPGIPKLDMGDIGFSAALDSEEHPNDFLDGVHFFVQASYRGDETPLFASKLGKRGPTVLHGFQDLAELYPQTTLGRASDFVALERTRDSLMGMVSRVSFATSSYLR